MITGGAGFIGANLVLYWLRHHPDDLVVNFDALTYAGNLGNLEDVKDLPNYRFFHGDLRNALEISKAFSEHNIEAVIHLAAESLVDRSIHVAWFQRKVSGIHSICPKLSLFFFKSSK